jgi:hypothetical protein
MLSGGDMSLRLAGLAAVAVQDIPPASPPRGAEAHSAGSVLLRGSVPAGRRSPGV